MNIQMVELCGIGIRDRRCSNWNKICQFGNGCIKTNIFNFFVVKQGGKLLFGLVWCLVRRISCFVDGGMPLCE